MPSGRLQHTGYSGPAPGDNAGQPNFPTPSGVAPATTPPDVHAARIAFMDTALFKSRKLTNPVANPAAGQTFDIYMGGVGYPIGVRIDVDAQLTTTLIPSVSQRYPFNLLSQFIYYDPSNDQARTIASGYQLRLRRMLATRKFPHNPSVSSPTTQAYSGGLYLAPTTLPSGTTQRLKYNYWLPLVVADTLFSGNFPDLRGIHSLSSAKKRASINLTVNPNIFAAAANDDALTYHNTGSDGCALTNLGLKFTEYYWAPVDPDGNGPILPPMEDQQEIFELKSSKAPSLNVGDDTPFFFETGRTYRGLIAELMSNGVLTTGSVGTGPIYSAPTPGVTAVKTMLNDNNYLLWEDLDTYLERIRDTYGFDLPPGVFHDDFRGREFNSDEYSDLAFILTLDPGFVTTQPSYMQVLREATYESDITQVAA